MASGPVTIAERTRIVEALQGGMARNEAAREFGRSPGTISKIAKESGISFDRSATKAASEAKQIDNKARRASLVEKLLVKADRLLDEMDSPYTAFRFGGKDNTYSEKTLPQPTDTAKRNLMVAVGIALQRAVEVEAVDQSSDEEYPAAWALVEAIRAMREDRDRDQGQGGA